jgi:hypothetical protein
VAFIVVVVVSILLVTACGSDSNDVATLKTTGDGQVKAPTADAENGALDNEERMMAFTECLREQGIEVMDPVVDADGNVDKPELAEGAEWGKEAGEAWEACEHHLKGFTGWGKEDADVDEQIEQLDRYIALATCLREKNYDLDDPTAETLDAWMEDFKKAIDWKDPDAVADYEECSGEAVGEGGK